MGEKESTVCGDDQEISFATNTSSLTLASVCISK